MFKISKKFAQIYLVINLGIFGDILFSKIVIAQIVPDTTLPQNSSVTVFGNTTKITGGTRAGHNLYHSFQEFSTSNGSSAFFNNALDIQNIISRVTGKSISNIDGTIKANGIANLFLINPNGIILGKNARLNIGGSFIASTATSLKFQSDLDFSATNPQPTPLLSISTPIGLQYGVDPGAIQVKGDGQGIRKTNELIDTNNALRVQSNQTLALLGGNIILEGATLKTAGGRIELGSVGSGDFIKINSTNNGFTFAYAPVQSFGDIQLSQGASVDSSGEGQGDIQVQARKLTIQDGSEIENSTLGEKAGGTLYVKTTDLIDISGTSADGQARSGLVSTVYPGAKGNGGNLIINTRLLRVQGGSGIATVTRDVGKSGNLIISASDSVLIAGFPSINPLITSTISSSIYGSGDGGDLILSTPNLTIESGATVGSAIFGRGNGGKIKVYADLIKVTGGSSLFSPSTLSNITFNQGNASSLEINTQKLIIADGGVVSTSATGSGNGGNLIVNASNSIEVKGVLQGSPSPFSSILSSEGTVAPLAVQKIYNLPPSVSGESGQVAVNTKRLIVTNGGIVSVSNQGTGQSGNLLINAADISLNQGNIIASTTSNNGGNIFINTDYLQMKNSTISATAGGRGNGGNITINGDILTGSKNSNITADAFEGRGGNITINAKGLFFSFDSFITASSRFGINGTVQFNIADPHFSPTQLKAEGIPVTPEITSACPNASGAAGNNFVVSDAGNLQSYPNKLVNNNVKQSTLVAKEQPINNSQNPKLSISKQPIEIIEANSITRNSQGDLVLTIDQANVAYSNAPLPANSCFSVPQQ
ncbi:filamentous hemagglutinin N-terminal domain-containing protein (plasmid) [Nostoc sp. UHCC 0302]|uniref:two-partner secretion domain-containing protein n=1 Tax=Nostoc sp. UHCC 0302 TaxID=3134896 RepID=UPI00311CC363